MKKTSLNLAVIISLLCLFTSCEKSNEIEQSSIKNGQLMEQFAASVAKAMQDAETRDFLKSEALKKVNGDFDILFNYSKFNTVSSKNKSFVEVLEKYNQGDVSILEIGERIPLLTISIPDLILAPTEAWDTKNHTPKVAVYTANNELLKAFNSKGETEDISSKIEPIETTIVIRENDRITCDSPKLKSAKLPQTQQLLFSDNGTNYYLPPIRETPPEYGDLPIIGENNSSVSQRESFYYSTGEMNYNAKETLRYFRLASSWAVKRVFDNNNIWANGDLEFECFIITGSSMPDGFKSLHSIRSVPRFAAAISGCRTASEFVSCFNFGSNAYSDFMKEIYKDRFNAFREAANNNPDHPNVSSDGKIFMTWGWEPFGWSPHEYGDRIQVIFKERDLTVEYTEEVTHTTKFDSSIGKKDKFNVGLNKTVSGKTKISYQTGSDPLGNCIISYFEDYGIENYVSTGDLEFVLEPLK